MVSLKTSSILLSSAVCSLAASGSKTCFDFDVPVAVSTEGDTFLLEPFQNSYASTQFLVGATTRTADGSLLIGPKQPINTTYTISAHYCTPCDKAGSGVLQVLTHGIGFGKSYWDFGGEENNYISAATTAGYATFSYDRLGIGQSDHPDPYFDVQSATELAILVELTKSLRAGTLHKDIPKPSKTVHVGHSFGSVLSNGLAAAHPELTDGVVLTGFSYEQSYMQNWQLCLGLRLAKEVEPAKWGNLSSGYVTWADKYDNQCAFLTFPYFSVDHLDVAEETKQPFTMGELLSIASIDVAAPGFTGPIQIITGDADVPFCGANCTGIVDDDTIPKELFPNATAISLYIQPDTGHGINIHYNASGAYSVINNFLQSNDL